MSSSEKRSLSVLVLTYNEEAVIDRCLSSVFEFADEIVVLDSYSTDRTVEIAHRSGARVEQYPFDGYANQRRRLIQLADHDWIFMLDADEYASDELIKSIFKAKEDNSYDAYTSNRRNRFGGKWLKHGSWYPDKKIRMFDRRKIAVTGIDVHEKLEPVSQVRIGHLKGDLMHDAGETVESRYEKIIGYSTRAAEGLYQQKKKWSSFNIFFKPIGRFVSTYLFRLGFLDGNAGLIVARSDAYYVWLREKKLRDLWKRR